MKVGDKVLCIDDKDSLKLDLNGNLVIRKSLKTGNIYTIRGFANNPSVTNDALVFLDEIINTRVHFIKSGNIEEYGYGMPRFIPFNPSEIEAEFEEEYLVKIKNK